MQKVLNGRMGERNRKGKGKQKEDIARLIVDGNAPTAEKHPPSHGGEEEWQWG
jgi:hypothetical protein